MVLTIQNHGGYYGEIPLDIDVVNVGGIPAGDAGYLIDLQTYINLLKISGLSVSKPDTSHTAP